MDKCTDCARHKVCKTNKIMGQGGTNASLMFVEDYPSLRDDERGTVFGDSKDLDLVLSEAMSVPPEHIYKTYLVKCLNGKPVTAKEFEACRKHLEAEVAAVKPEVIVAMGDTVTKMLTGWPKIGKNRGKVREIELGGRTVKVIPTYSSFYIANTPTALESWALDIYKAYNISRGASVVNTGTKVVVCDTFEKIKTAVAYCKETGVVAFDYETKTIDDKGLNTHGDDFFATTLSLSFQAGSAYVIPLEHKDSPFNDRAVVIKIHEYLTRHLFANPDVRKVAHNADFDCHVLRMYGGEIRGRLDDTMLMHHLYDETLRHRLKEIVATHLPDFAGYDDELDKDSWEKIPLDSLLQYNGTDTDMTLRLCTQLENKLLEDEQVYTIYRNLTMAAFKPLFAAESRGMVVNMEALTAAITQANAHIAHYERLLREHKVVRRYELVKEQSAKDAAILDLTAKIDAWMAVKKAGLKTEIAMREKLQAIKRGALSVYDGLNFNSPAQMADLLFNHPAGFEFSSLTGSTGKDELEDLPDDTGFVELLQVYRGLKKITGTYLEGMMKRIDRNGRIHTSFLLSGTVSGRLSSRNPNLQNLPNLAKLSNEHLKEVVASVKSIFGVPDGHTFVQLDFSQAELRIIADFANEENMLTAYNNGIDLHALTGATILKTDLTGFYQLPKDRQKEYRTRAKAGNFGFIYGLSPEGFTQYAKSNYKVEYSEKEAVAYRNDFFKLYPRLLDYHAEYIQKARRYGWVRTLFGRRRRTPDINSFNDYRRGEEQRVAVNSPIQGTAGELTIFAIALLFHRLDSRVLFVNTVHDSIQFYVPDDLLVSAIKIMEATCEKAPTLQYFGAALKRVGMKVDVEISKESWKALAPYGPEN